MSLLKYVLQQYPRSRLKDVPVDELAIDELAFIAGEWIGEGRAVESVVLLEQLFADPGRLDERAEHAFDVLADCYDALNRPKKKRALIERCLEAPDRTLRSAALHRRMTMLADRGQFWITRLARDRDHDYGDLIGHIRELISNPDEAAFRHESADIPGLQRLRAPIPAMPAPACCYDIQRDESDGCLVPRLDVRKLLATWREAAASIPRATPDFATGERGTGGLDFLETHPLAWQCFDILDAVARAVAEADVTGADELLLVPLMERGCTLLRLALADNDAQRCALPWSFVENRPALQLVAELIWIRRKQRRLTEARELAKWMVSTLNPADNHGLREDLVQMCFEQGDAEGVLAVCDRYPNDLLAVTLFGRPLALHQLGRDEEAASALRDAARHEPHVLPMLLAANPKRTRTDPTRVTVGGNDEAWWYREENRALRETASALEWTRGIARQAGSR